MNNEKIVIISDSDNIHLYSYFYLESVTSHLCSYEETDYLMQKLRPDIAIIDFGFNVSTALALLRKMKSKFPSIPIIFLSSISSEELVIKIFQGGARDFIKKPVGNDYLQLKEVRSAYTPINENSEESTSVARDLPSNIICALQYIEHNLSGNVTLSSLAKEANLSKHHFCRVFKKYIGKSSKRYIIDIKIEKAKNLLMDVDNNVSIVAWETGFNDLSSFIKHFKRTTGVTPSDYRKEIIKLSERSA